MTDNGNAPTTERGTAVATVYNWTGMLPWSQFMDDAEKAPDLQWPRSIQAYDQMRNDAQCQGLYLGATAALRRYGWYIDPNGCDAAYTDLLAADLNLVVGEDAAREALASGAKSASLRSSGRFSWYQHLAMCLRAMYYGHFYFEQVGTITNDGPNGRETWRLRKLGPRHPRTITEIKVADDGGLVSITQGYGTAGMPPPEVPSIAWSRMYGTSTGNWVGRSIYRPMYRNWLVKDRLLRVDAIKHERNGVGMPVVEGPPGATRDDLLALDKMAQEYKAGERGGGAVPNGTRLRLVGTEGSIPDTIGLIRFHNEEMARSMLMMFMQLGQTETGSRALGESMIDWFKEQQTYIADWVVSTTVEHVIEDWWGWNVDPLSDRTPRLGYVTGEQGAPQPGDFAGAELPPEMSQAFKQQQDAPGPGAVARRRPHQHRAAEPLTDLPGSSQDQRPTDGVVARLPHRKLHRQPYPHEIAAAVDYGGLEEDADAGQEEAQRSFNDQQMNFFDWLTVKLGEAKAAKAASEEFYSIRQQVHEQEFAKVADEAFAATIARAANRSKLRAIQELFAQGMIGGGWILPAVIISPLDDLVIAAALGYGYSMRDTLVANAHRLTARVQNAAESVHELTQQVVDDLMGRQDVWASDQLRGMVNTAANQQRVAVFEAAQQDADVKLYASELLDINTCPACSYIDGNELTVAQARRYYGAGSYIECDGGPRCRGTVVAVYSGERSY